MIHKCSYWIPHTFMFFTSALFLLLTSCSPIYYAPNSLNVPLLPEVGETNLTAAGNADQIEIQGA